MSRGARSGFFGCFAVLVCVACGGEDKGRPSPDIVVAPPFDECTRVDKYTTAPIVDFEPHLSGQGAMVRSAICAPGIPCENPPPVPFYFNWDKAHTDPKPEDSTAICPAPARFATAVLGGENIIPLPMHTGDSRDVNGSPIPGGPRCGGSSTSALHLVATDVAMCVDTVTGRLGWGAGLDLNFVKTGSGFDASGYDGIGFWVKKGEGATVPALVFSVVDDQNNGVGGDFDQAEPPGCGCYAFDSAHPTKWTCSTDPGPEYPDVVKCDAFGAAITLTDEWSFVPIEFAKMRQKGFGFVSKPFDSSKIKRLQFLMQYGNWDFWIDDIVLFKKK